MRDYPDYDPALYYATCNVEQVDEWTVKDTYYLIEKTDEMCVLEEMLEVMNLHVSSGLVQLDGHGGVLV